jgi:hypothetical protein
MESAKLTLPGELHLAGYDREEEYFYRENRRLIAELRAASARGEKPVAPTEVPIDHHPWVTALRHVLERATKPLPSGIGQFPV